MNIYDVILFISMIPVYFVAWPLVVMYYVWERSNNVNSTTGNLAGISSEVIYLIILGYIILRLLGLV